MTSVLAGGAMFGAVLFSAVLFSAGLFFAATSGASAQNCADQASLQSPPGTTQATEVTFVNTVTAIPADFLDRPAGQA